MDLQGFIRHFSLVDKSAAPNRNVRYPMVPGSIPAETPRIRIHLHFSYYTFKQGFETSVSSSSN